MTNKEREEVIKWVDIETLICSIENMFADNLKREPTQKMVKDFYLDMFGNLGTLVKSFIHYKEI